MTARKLIALTSDADFSQSSCIYRRKHTLDSGVARTKSLNLLKFYARKGLFATLLPHPVPKTVFLKERSILSFCGKEEKFSFPEVSSTELTNSVSKRRFFFKD